MTIDVMRFVNLLVLKALMNVHVVLPHMQGLLYFGNQLFAPCDEFSKWHARECLFDEGESTLRCSKIVVTNITS